MTVSSSTRKAGPYIGAGTTSTFPFSFKVFQASDVLVVRLDTATQIETTLALTTNYTVSLNADQDNSPGGNITLVGGALATGYNLVISSKVPYTQGTDITNMGGFYPEVIEDALDKLCIEVQQIKLDTDRAAKLPITSTQSTDDLVADLVRIADSADNIDIVANNIGDVNDVADNMADVNLVADHMAELVNFATVYQGSAATDPATRLNGSPLQPGDLYFNTTYNEMRVYTASGWKSTVNYAATVERFSGDGSTVAFNLSAAPLGENNTQLYISGVYQQKNTYDVSGTTITFSSAPPSGTDNIEVVVFTSLIAGATVDSANVQFTPAGAGAVSTTVQNQLRGNNTTSPETRGFFEDESGGANVHRLKDRVMVGNAANYTGNRRGANGYGSSWTTSKGASYFIKNATMAVAAEETDSLGARRYGIVGFSKSMGVGAVAVNDGVETFARGLYAEGFHQITQTDGSGYTVGIEVQMGNYTSSFPVANAYQMANVETSALYIGAESGIGYTTGNSDTPIPVPTNPCGCAIDISGGSLGASYQKWVTGIVFRNGGLYRDAVTEIGIAISMAYKHELIWGIGQTQPRVAYIRSEVTSISTASGLILQNRGILSVGYNNQKIFETYDSRVTNDDAINWIRVANSQTNSPVVISSQGTDTDIDLRFVPKGNGKMQFGFYSATTGLTQVGYITIKDNFGVERKLAVVS